MSAQLLYNFNKVLYTVQLELVAYESWAEEREQSKAKQSGSESEQKNQVHTALEILT